MLNLKNQSNFKSINAKQIVCPIYTFEKMHLHIVPSPIFSVLFLKHLSHSPLLYYHTGREEMHTEFQRTHSLEFVIQAENLETGNTLWCSITLIVKKKKNPDVQHNFPCFSLSLLPPVLSLSTAGLCTLPSGIYRH